MVKPLWQTSEWKTFQEALGHKTLKLENQALMMIYSLPFSMNYGYLERGFAPFPVLKKTAKENNLVFIRIDPEDEVTLSHGACIRKSFSVQPETSLILDLTLSDAQLLAQMKRKGRYNIQLAQKKGVQVKIAEKEERELYAGYFYQLLQETIKRDDFFSHDENYYKTFLKTIPSSEIFVAFYDEKPLAAGIFCFQKERALYYYGASSHQKKELMAPYLLQWEAISEAKHRGCKEYDFFGIADEDGDPNHPWKGITEFKKKFGGKIIRYPKPIDIIFKPWKYLFYRFMKVVQKFIKK